MYGSKKEKPRIVKIILREKNKGRGIMLSDFKLQFEMCKSTVTKIIWEGTYVYLWLIHVMFGRNQYNIVEELSFN